MQTSAMLAARGMQCDSYLPGSSHPVICCSEPLSTLVSKPGMSGGPQVVLDLQVSIWYLKAGMYYSHLVHRTYNILKC